jgi:putative transposase
VLFALLYLLISRAVRLGVGSASDLHNDIEVMVLRHQLAVLKRHVGRPQLRRRDRLFMAAISMVLPRSRWSSFAVSPQTLCAGTGSSSAGNGHTVGTPVAGDRQSPMTFGS